MSQPIIRTTYGGPPPDTHVFEPPRSEHAAASAASREASQREMALQQALNRPGPPLAKVPSLKQPLLPADFQSRLDALDEEIHGRGIAVSKERLLALGKERFQDLLAKDGAARSLQRVVGARVDLSSWASVEQAFASVNALLTKVPRRKNAEILAGKGKDREEAAKISGFGDLWKAQQEPQSVRDVYAFHDVFASLVFGQSMLDQLASDGRVRAYTFAGSGRPKAGYFADWLSVLDGPHFKVVIAQPLWHLLAWLTHETTPLEPATLAREWFGVRSPSREQERLCAAVLEAFLLDFREWALWQHVGRITRQANEYRDLEAWRGDLAKCYPAISDFHDVIRTYFWREVGGNVYDARHEFDEAGYRQFIDRNVRTLSNRLSGLTALTIEELLPNACVARFQDSIVCKGNKPKAVPTAEKIERKLLAAFPSARFNIGIGEVRHDS